MGARGQPIETKDKQWSTLKILRLLTTQNGYNFPEYASNLKFPIISHYINGC